MPESFIGKKWRNVWLFRNSVFKNWITDTETLVNDCFEFDWTYVKPEKIILDSSDL